MASSDLSSKETYCEFCGMRLQPMILPRNMITMYLIGFAALGSLSAVSVLQPYLLSTFLRLDPALQGAVAANARTFGQIAIIFTVPLMGVVSNRLGRRGVCTGAFVWVALSFFMLPFSRSPATMIMFTVLVSVGLSTATMVMTTLPGDYVSNQDRGKANAYVAIANGVGIVLLGGGVGKLPGLVGASPWATPDGIGEGYFAYWCMAACTLATATLTGCGLASAEAQAREVSTVGTVAESSPAEGRRQDPSILNPGIVLACLVQMFAGAAIQVNALFIPQWCVSFALQQAAAEMGITSGATMPEEHAALISQTGLAKGSTYLGIMGLGSLIAAPIFGRLTDSRDRIMLQFWSLLLAFVGYMILALHSNPFARTMYATLFFVGVGQIGVVVSNHAFVQQQAPPESRGIVMGIFMMSQAMGQVLEASLGGQLFYLWRMQGPFWVLACATLVAALLCLAMKKYITAPTLDETTLQPQSG